MHHEIVNVVTLIACAGIAAQWLATRFRIPSIVVLPAAGILVGPVTGMVDPARNFGGLLRPIIPVAVAVIFLVRPLAVFTATLGAGMDLGDRVIAGWIAPRGIVAAAVAGAFSIRLLEAGYADAGKLLPLVFSLIILSHAARLLARCAGAAPWTGRQKPSHDAHD